MNVGAWIHSCVCCICRGVCVWCKHSSLYFRVCVRGCAGVCVCVKQTFSSHQTNQAPVPDSEVSHSLIILTFLHNDPMQNSPYFSLSFPPNPSGSFTLSISLFPLHLPFLDFIYLSISPFSAPRVQSFDYLIFLDFFLFLFIPSRFIFPSLTSLSPQIVLISSYYTPLHLVLSSWQ